MTQGKKKVTCSKCEQPALTCACAEKEKEDLGCLALDGNNQPLPPNCGIYVQVDGNWIFKGTT